MNKIHQFIKVYCIENTNFVVSAYENYNDKISIALTYKNEKMISIEILKNFVSDFLLVDIESENLIESTTKYYQSVDEVLFGIKSFLDSVENNY